MGEPNLQLLSFLSIAFSIKTFVETGSGHGDTTVKALSIFPVVHTIELDKALYLETNKRVGKVAGCYRGKSVEVLTTILPGVSGPIVYWLDAHFTGGTSSGENEQCPLLKELGVINQREGNNDFIMVDDAHVFYSPALISKEPGHDIKQWPDIMQIFAALNVKDRYTVILSSWRCVLHGKPGGIVFPEDVIVSVPSYAKDQLFTWLLSLNLEH